MPGHDVLIVGGGPAGLALALALKDSDLDIAIVDARDHGASAADPRTLALAHGSRLTLERLGVWPSLAATPIETIHVSQQGGFGRTLIRATDYGLPALGYTVSAGELARVMHRAVAEAGIPIASHCEMTAVTPGSDLARVTLRTPDGVARRTARLVACAEGGPGPGATDVVERDYGQHALIAFAHLRNAPAFRAWERFTPEGPIALLPCADRYALVHVTASEAYERWLDLDDSAYLARLQQRFGSRLELTAIDARSAFPLRLRYRKRPIAPRTVWLGNAAQTLHPVAGQGFNLALRDLWTLAATLQTRAADPGSTDTLEAYARRRGLDRHGTVRFTDALVRLFCNDLAPLRHLRGAGLLALDILPPLRGFLARRLMFGARAWP